MKDRYPNRYNKLPYDDDLLLIGCEHECGDCKFWGDEETNKLIAIARLQGIEDWDIDIEGTCTLDKRYKYGQQPWEYHIEPCVHFQLPEDKE